MLTGSSDQELAKMYKEGYHDAFTEIIERQRAYIMSIIAGYIRDPDTVEEITQETFIKLERIILTHPLSGDFSHWVKWCAINTVRDHLRSVKRRKRKTQYMLHFSQIVDPKDHTGSEMEYDSYCYLAAQSRPPEELLIAEELKQALWAAVARLSPTHQQAITLVYIEGMTHGEAAKSLGVPKPTLQSRVEKAVSLLRGMLGDSGDALRFVTPSRPDCRPVEEAA